MKPRQGTLVPARLATAAALALAALAVSVSPASAAESSWPTVQAKATNGEWIPYLDPPENPAAICLVDSGVDVTPDTPADSPSGPIVKRLSLDGGPGTAASQTWEGRHGTRMAFAAGAPRNDWGTIGLWPGLRIVSVRAMPRGESAFPFDDYRRAIKECTYRAREFNIVAINLSLSCSCVASPEEVTRLEDSVTFAHQSNLSVIASAGNDGASVGSPANAAGIFAVGALDAGGAFCRFSNRGSALDIAAPGCELDGADTATGAPVVRWSGGTSAAAAQVSSALAVLRSYRRDIGWRAAEKMVGEIASRVATRDLDIAALFESAGLDFLVTAARARIDEAADVMEAGAAADTAVPTALGPFRASERNLQLQADAGTARMLPSPRIDSIFRIRRRLTIAVRNRPVSASLGIQIQRRRGEFRFVSIQGIKRRSDVITFRVPRSPRSLRLAIGYRLRGQRSSTLFRRVPR